MFLNGRPHGVREGQGNPKYEDKSYNEEFDPKHHDIYGVVHLIRISRWLIASRSNEDYKIVDTAHKDCEEGNPNNYTESPKCSFNYLSFLRVGENFGGRQQNDTQKEKTANH